MEKEQIINIIMLAISATAFVVFLASFISIMTLSANSDQTILSILVWLERLSRP